MFVLGCVSVLGLVVSVLCIGLTAAILYQYYKQTIALEALIRYTAEVTGKNEDKIRKVIIEAKRRI